MDGFALRLHDGASFAMLAQASLPEDVVEGARQQFERIRHRLENLVNDYAISPHCIEVEFTSSLEFNAKCGAQSHGDLVSLNAGIYVWSYIIACLIDASAQDAELREAYEASSFMLDVREYENAGAATVKAVLDEYHAHFGASRGAGKVLSNITDCIWLHEIAHSLLGHAEYVAKAYGTDGNALQERTSSRRRRHFPTSYIEERRFMEWEADRFAGALAAISVVEQGNAVDGDVEELALILYGYAILVSAFADANMGTPNDELYPSPLCRFLSFQLGMNIKGGEVGFDVRDLFKEGTMERSVQLCFEMLSELGNVFPAVRVFGRLTASDFKEAVVDEYVAIAASPGIGQRLSSFRKFSILTSNLVT